MAPKEPTLWDIIGILNTKTGELAWDDDKQKLYTPYIINRNFSFTVDTILSANEMNSRHFLDKKTQYEYYLHDIRKMKRYPKWVKKEAEEESALLIEYYDISAAKAKAILGIHTAAQLQRIKTILEKGGDGKPAKKSKTA